jgi:hypothetical protein
MFKGCPKWIRFADEEIGYDMTYCVYNIGKVKVKAIPITGREEP